MHEIMKPVLDQYDPKTGQRFESDECPDIVLQLDAVISKVPRKFYVDCLPIDLPGYQSRHIYDACMPLVRAGFKFDVLIVDSIIGSVFAGLTYESGRFNEDGTARGSDRYSFPVVPNLIQPLTGPHGSWPGSPDLIEQAEALDRESDGKGDIPAITCPICFDTLQREVNLYGDLRAKFGFFNCQGKGKQLSSPNRGCRQYLYSYSEKEEMIGKVKCLVPDRRVLF